MSSDLYKDKKTLKTLYEDLKNEPCNRMHFEELWASNRKIYDRFKEAYPSLFSDLDYLNFDLPKGWVVLCMPLFQQLEDYGIKLIQVKQKLGQLRIHTDRRADLTREVEKQAAYICEFCSSATDVKEFANGYISNACIECRRKCVEFNLLSWLLGGGKEWKGLSYNIAMLREVEDVSGTSEQDN